MGLGGLFLPFKSRSRPTLFNFNWSKKKMIKLKAPKGMYGVSWNGEEYYTDKKGIVEVPGEAVPELLNFGYKVVDQKGEPKQQQATNDDDNSGAEGGEGQGETDNK